MRKPKFNPLEIKDAAEKARISFLAAHDVGDYTKATEVLLTSAIHRALHLIKREGLAVDFGGAVDPINPYSLLLSLLKYLRDHSDDGLVMLRVATDLVREVCTIKAILEGEDQEDIPEEQRVAKFMIAAFELGNLHNMAMMVETKLIDNLGEAVHRLHNGKAEGGNVRAQQLAEKAALWKAEYLPEAIAIARLHPTITRSGLATRLLVQFGDSRSHKTVENWLKDEVEPTGVIGNRSRTKPA